MSVYVHKKKQLRCIFEVCMLYCKLYKLDLNKKVGKTEFRILPLMRYKHIVNSSKLCINLQAKVG